MSLKNPTKCIQLIIINEIDRNYLLDLRRCILDSQTIKYFVLTGRLT